MNVILLITGMLTTIGILLLIEKIYKLEKKDNTKVETLKKENNTKNENNSHTITEKRI
jgi:hypothetical protein